MGLRRRADARQASSIERVYYANRLLSQTGQGIFMAAVLVLAGGGGSIALGLSSVFVAMMAGSLLFGLLGSALADRLGPGLALVIGMVARTACILSALVVAPEPLNLGLIAFLYSASSQLMCPAELALVSVVANGRPARVHGVLVALQHTGYGLGVLIAAPLLHLAGGATFMILGSACLYLVAIAVSFFIFSRVVRLPSVAPARHAFSFSSTAAYFIRRPVAGHAALTLAFAEVSAKALIISLPAYILHDLGLTAPVHFLLAVPAGAGAVLGIFWAARFFQLRDAPEVLRLALIGTVVSLVALAGLGAAFSELAESANQGLAASIASSQRLSVVVAVPVALLLGACYAVTPIAARGVLSATAPAGQQARVFGMQATFTDILCILPIALSGLSTEVAGARTTFLAIGLFGACIFVFLEVVRASRREPIGGVVAVQPTPVTLNGDA